MGRNASDHSEGKEVSDSTEKYASDGSEGSEAYETMVNIHLDQSNIHHPLHMLPKKEISPLQVFSF